MAFRSRLQLRRLPRILLALAIHLLALPAAAFTIDDNFIVFAGGEVDVLRTLTEAPRWTATPGAPAGLEGGISVGMRAGAAAEFGFDTPDGIDEFRAMILDSFAGWTTPDVQFDVNFDVSGSGSSYDIFLDVLDSTDPEFSGNSFSGITFFGATWDPLRTLTNGSVVPGWSITNASIAFAEDRVTALIDFFISAGLMTEEQYLDRLQKLVMHEIGHAMGLDHADEFPAANFDDDGDPLTPIAVDPSDPFAGIVVSPNIDQDALMQGGLNINASVFFLDELRPDDLSGYRVLYPVPEPRGLLLLTLPLALLATRRS